MGHALGQGKGISGMEAGLGMVNKTLGLRLL